MAESPQNTPDTSTPDQWSSYGTPITVTLPAPLADVLRRAVADYVERPRQRGGPHGPRGQSPRRHGRMSGRGGRGRGPGMRDSSPPRGGGGRATGNGLPLGMLLMQALGALDRGQHRQRGGGGRQHHRGNGQGRGTYKCENGKMNRQGKRMSKDFKRNSKDRKRGDRKAQKEMTLTRGPVKAGENEKEKKEMSDEDVLDKMEEKVEQEIQSDDQVEVVEPQEQSSPPLGRQASLEIDLNQFMPFAQMGLSLLQNVIQSSANTVENPPAEPAPAANPPPSPSPNVQGLTQEEMLQLFQTMQENSNQDQNTPPKAD